MRSVQSAWFVGLACLALASASAGAAELKIDENDGPHGGVPDDGYGWFKWNGPVHPGDPIWFDVLVNDAMGDRAQNIQITLSVVPVATGAITFDAAESEAVENDVSYWVFGDSVGAGALDLGSDTYQFGDSPDSGVAESLINGDIVARFAFTWDGVVDDYLVTVDTGLSNTSILDENFETVAPSWVSNPVMLHVPEPTTVAIIAVGSLAALRRRRGVGPRRPLNIG